MQNESDVLSYARSLADELEKEMHWQNARYDSGGWWEANTEQAATKIRARTISALEFFRQYAGQDSFWTHRAIETYEEGQNSNPSVARDLAQLLRAWADQVEAGVTEIAGAKAWAEIGVVSTDIMAQVRRLLADKSTHPAAAIVLCGAALEISLRAVADARSLVLEERPSMSAYTRLLRKAELITVQDVKDFEQCGGLRNAAAHGEFDNLSAERAGLMEQQTNILLRRLADIQNTYRKTAIAD